MDFFSGCSTRSSGGYDGRFLGRSAEALGLFQPLAGLMGKTCEPMAISLFDFSTLHLPGNNDNAGGFQILFIAVASGQIRVMSPEPPISNRPAFSQHGGVHRKRPGAWF